jgi:thymidylate synthase (FAD)
MKLIPQSATLVHVTPNAEKMIESAGRTCYKSEHRITNDSAREFVKGLASSGHLSVVEHDVATFRFVTNRGVTHELVRHRLASYSQESTRYVRYQDVEYITPTWWADATEDQKNMLREALTWSEFYYNELLQSGWRPEQAREVLPNALKTEIVMTANLREWIHVFNLRCSKKAHPQIRELMWMAKRQLAFEVPSLFE